MPRWLVLVVVAVLALAFLVPAPRQEFVGVSGVSLIDDHPVALVATCGYSVDEVAFDGYRWRSESPQEGFFEFDPAQPAPAGWQWQEEKASISEDELTVEVHLVEDGARHFRGSAVDRARLERFAGRVVVGKPFASGDQQIADREGFADRCEKDFAPIEYEPSWWEYWAAKLGAKSIW